MLKRFRGLLVLILTALAVLTSGCSAGDPLTEDLYTSADVYVDGTINWVAGNVTFVPQTGNIQTYIDSAVDGDTLVLASGEYSVANTITVNKQLNIVGQGNVGFVTFPILSSHGTVLSCTTNNVVALQVSSSNVRIAHLSISMTGDDSMAVSTANNLSGLVFTDIDVLVECAGTAQAFTIYGSNVVLRDLTFYVSSADSTASGVLVYNNNTTTQDTIVDAFIVTGVVVGGAVSAYTLECWNDNDDNTITLNLSESICKSLAGTPLDVAVVSHSTTTNNSIVNAYMCTFDGAVFDARQTGTNELNLGGSVLVNNSTFGTVTYRAAMVSGNLVALENVNFSTLSIYANNATAIAGGLVVGDLYRTGNDPDIVCVVH